MHDDVSVGSVEGVDDLWYARDVQTCRKTQMVLQPLSRREIRGGAKTLDDHREAVHETFTADDPVLRPIGKDLESTIGGGYHQAS
jgi:hypothetical protein